MDIAYIRQKVKKQEYDLSGHAHRERQEEQITISEIELTLLGGDIIEKYPNDQRGGSCLVAANVDNNPLHLVCGKRNNRLLIVTVYRPKPSIWKNYKLLQLKSWSFALSLHELCWRSVYSLAFIFDINVEVFSRVNINDKVKI